ncbi:serine/threonine protein kinase [Candidatus Obscuribacterales bacterium]|nr:serine/threonine protein kinase [Candidatus Obscuribacterales bacterium]MBX3151004.1 serine/threonine protein kinase [Candidatus Obscuribacterales bacterium]
MDEFWKSNLVAERYEYVEELGKGGIGTVVLARDKVLDKLVAIKILNANLSAEESIRFQQEGILSGKLKHDNIVAVLDFGVTETNVPYLIMEHLQGFTLAHMVTTDGALEPLFAVRIFQQIARGMRNSHNTGVVHRDLKPANVFMVVNEDETLSAKIVDFGLARLLSQDARLTATGTAIGSPLYMSPEQGQGMAGDERSDIYSMGCLMYQVLTGRVPFEGDSPMLTIAMHISATPESLGEKTGKRYAPLLEQTVARCLKKKADERYQSFEELLKDLERIEAELIRLEREEALEAVSRSGVQRALSSVTDFATPLAAASKRNLALMLVAVTALVGATVLGFYLLLPQFNKPAPPEEKTELIRFADSLETFSKIKVDEENGETQAKGYGENTDTDLKQLARYRRLDKLSLNGSSCVGTGLSFLAGTTIIELNLDSTPLSDDGMREVNRVKGLQKLLVKDCDELHDSSFALLSGNKTLKHISLSASRNLTERVFRYLQTYPMLESIGLDEFHVTRDGIADLLKVSKLNTIVFEECNLDKGVLEALARHKTPLERVGLADMIVTPNTVSELKHVNTRYITLHDVKMTGALHSQILKDHRYVWSDTEVDGKEIDDLLR